MSIVGEVKNGVAVCESALPWPDGTRVVIELAEEPQRGSLLERLEGFVGVAEGLPTDLAKNHDHYLHGHTNPESNSTSDETNSAVHKDHAPDDSQSPGEAILAWGGFTDDLPEDMAENLDHYLHGSPRR